MSIRVRVCPTPDTAFFIKIDGGSLSSIFILSIHRLVKEAASQIENLQRSGKSRQSAWNASTVVLTWAAKVVKVYTEKSQ